MADTLYVSVTFIDYSRGAKLMKNERGVEVVFIWSITKSDGCSLSMPYYASDLLCSSRIDDDVKGLILGCIAKGDTVSNGNSSWTRNN